MPRNKLFTKEEVLNKAMQLFWRKGYHATSIQDLVDHLEINRASLYDTFGGKKQLFDQAFDLYRATYNEKVISFLKEHSNIREALTEMFEMAVSESFSDPDRKGCFVVNTTTEFLPGDSYLQREISSNKTVFEKVLHDLLLTGEARGEIPPGKDLKAMAGLIYMIYNGMRVITKVKPDRKDLMASISAALSLLD